jgi:hypothetical protein
MGCVLLAEGQLRGAVKILSASSAIAKLTGHKPEPELQEPSDKALLEIREKLDGSDFQSEWTAGQVLTMEDAVRSVREM